MSRWEAWRLVERTSLAKYVSTRAEELLPGPVRPDPAEGQGTFVATARAIYEMLLGQQIQYAPELYHPSEAIQEIRTPSAVLAAPRRGTCLDLALMYCGIALANDLLPVVVVLDGHALALVSATHGLPQWDAYRPGLDAFYDDPVTDPDTIRRLVASGDFLPVECTGLARVHSDPDGTLGLVHRVHGYLSFDAATEHGRSLINGSGRPLVFAIDVAIARNKWRLEELDFEPVPIGPSGAEVDQLVIPHAQALHEMDRHRRYLLDSHLSFVSPGQEHPTEPANLFARLSREDSGRGVILTGFAGAGKTRTCQEVASQAVQQGWRVLHVRPIRQVTAAHVELAVLREPSARTLLVLDYLDVCADLDIEALDRIGQSVQRAGGRLALIATSRPGRMPDLLSRGAEDVFDRLQLREDDDHFESVAARIFDQVAPQAVARLGMAGLTEICSRRPAFALLISLDVEQLVASGQSIPTGAGLRSDALTRWLRNRLRTDYLLPAQNPGASPFDEDQADTTVLACALATATTPRPRAEIEGLIQRFLDGRGGGRAQVIVDILSTMGWLQQIGDSIEPAHDIVADEFIRQSVAPQSGLRVRDRELHALLDALLETPEALDRFVDNVARVHADLPSRQADQLERACSEWILLRAPQLGELFTHSTSGGQVLYSLLNAAPWQKSVSQCWDAVVEPWLDAEFGSNDRSQLLSYALRAVPPWQASPIITAALVWLAGQRHCPEAGTVLGRLLSRPDLSASEAGIAVDHALHWLRLPRLERDRTFVLRTLLRLNRVDERRHQQIFDAAVECIQRDPMAYTADFILRLLIPLSAKTAAQHVVIEAALAWLDVYGSDNRAGFVLRPLLTSKALTGAELETVCQLALDWLHEHGTSLDATFTLRPLLTDHRYRACSRNAEVVQLADRWMARHGQDWRASYLLPGLLAMPGTDQEGDEAGHYLQAAFDWLDLHSYSSDASWVLRALLDRRSRMDPDDERGQEIIRRSLASLEACPPEERGGQGYVLPPLLSQLRHAALADDTDDASEALRVLRLVGQAVRADLDHPSVSYLLGDALAFRHLPTAEGRDLVDLAFSWLDGRRRDHVSASRVLGRLLEHMPNGWMGDERRTGIIQRSVRWLAVGEPDMAQSYLLIRLLRSDRLDEAQTIEVVNAAFVWLGQFPEGAAADAVLQAMIKARVIDRQYASGGASVQPDVEGSAVTEILHSLASCSSRNIGDARKAGDAALSWLRANGDHPSAILIQQAVLQATGIILEHVAEVFDASLAWVKHHPDHTATARTLQALLRARWVGYGKSVRAAEAAFTWLDRHPEHPAVNALLQALLCQKDLDRRNIGQAADRALAWLTANPGDPAASFVLRTILGARGLDRRRLTTAADLALSFLREDPDGRSAVFLLQALLNAKTLGHERLAATVDTALGWTDRHDTDPGVPYLLPAMLSTKVGGQQRMARATALALQWVEGHPREENLSYLLRILLQTSNLRADVVGRVVDVAFEWLEANEASDKANYVVQAPLKAKKLDQARVDCAASKAIDWLAGHPENVGVPYVLWTVLANKRLTSEHAERAADLAFGWCTRNRDNGDLNYALRGLLACKRLDEVRRRKAFEEALDWLSRNRSQPTASFVIQDLLKAEPADADHADRAFQTVLGWLGAYPADRTTPHVFRAALTAPSIGVQHAARLVELGLAWVTANPGHPESGAVGQALLTCPVLGESSLAVLAARVASIAFDWLVGAPDSADVGDVLQGLLSCEWLCTADAERASALALDALRGARPVTGRHVIYTKLLARAERAADGSDQYLGGLVPLGLGIAAGLTSHDRAYIYTQIAKLADPPAPALDQIIAWLDTDEAEHQRPTVLPQLLRQVTGTGPRRQRLVEITVGSLSVIPPHFGFGIVSSLAPWDELLPEQAAVVRSWLSRNITSRTDPGLLTMLQKRQDLPAPWPDRVRRAAMEILTEVDDVRDHSVLVAALVPDPALASEDISRIIAAQTHRPASAALVAALAVRETVAAVGRALQAFRTELAQAALPAAGLGPVYEVCYQELDEPDGIGTPVSVNGFGLGLPVPVGCLDLVVRMSAIEREPDLAPASVTMFVAPGDGSVAGAADIGGPAHPGADKADQLPAETVQLYGQIAMASLDLGGLRPLARPDRVALLQNLAEHELRTLLTGSLETRDLALVIGYDPALRIAFWISIDPDPFTVWRTVAQFDSSGDQLVIDRPIPVPASEQDLVSKSRRSRLRVILRRRGRWT